MPICRKQIHPRTIAIGITQEQTKVRDTKLQSLGEKLHPAHCFLLPRYQWWQPCLGHMDMSFLPRTQHQLGPIQAYKLVRKKQEETPIFPKMNAQKKTNSTRHNQTLPRHGLFKVKQFWPISMALMLLYLGRYLPMH